MATACRCCFHLQPTDAAPGGGRRNTHAALAFLLIFLVLPPAVEATVWNLDETSQAGQLTIFNAEARGTISGMPLAAGDLDGDGRDEVVLAPFALHQGSGALVVVSGRNAIEGALDLAAEPQAALTIRGVEAGASLGCEVEIADVTGDGFEDLIIGAPGRDGPGGSRQDAGRVYVLPGSPRFGAEPIDLADAATGRIVIHGEDAADGLGCWVSSGDIDGDGIADILASASNGDGPDNTREEAGDLYLIFGGAQLQGEIDLASPGALRFVVLHGPDAGDRFGAQPAVGDFDGDGRADVLAGSAQLFSPIGDGAADGLQNHRMLAGEATIIYGEVLQAGRKIDIAALPARARSVFFGAAEEDNFGEDVHAADFNGDGISDAIIGAVKANRSYLVLGGPQLRGA